jgi:hypothetical protein
LAIGHWRKVAKFRNLAIFWWHARTYCPNLAISESFSSKIWQCGGSFCLNLAISEFFGRMLEPFVRIWQFQNFWRDAGTFCVNMALSNYFCLNLATLNQNFPKKSAV